MFGGDWLKRTVSVTPSIEQAGSVTPSVERAVERATGAYTAGRTVQNRAQMVLRRKLRERPVGSVAESDFDAVLERYHDEPTVFVHVRLSDVKAAFGCDPYEFLLGKLDERFDSVLSPRFTPSFRKDDGLYHKEFSEPRFGTFSTLFFEDCDYRTDDATNSILVRGEYRFDDADHHDTWSEDGCFAALDRDDVLYLNVGTDWLTASRIHYLETLFDVSYVRTVEYEGVIYYDETTFEPVTQRTHEYARSVSWNRAKIADDLARDGVLDRYDLDGLKLFAFNARELREALEPRIDADPYYLVT